MSEPSEPKKFRCACPECGKSLVGQATHVGKRVRCPACSSAFVLAPPKATIRVIDPGSAAGGSAAGGSAVPGAAVPGAAVPGAAVPGAAVPGAGGPHCLFCHSPIEAAEASTTCSGCGGVLHEECWEHNSGCGAYGCSEAPETEGLLSLEIPPSYWGREEKGCPNCRQTILAAAVRCRHCGVVFSSATPQGEQDYDARKKIEGKLPGVRTASVWLLVFSMLPCTAPLAAIIGPIWYWRNQATIRALPALNGALCKIAVGVAIAQLGLFIIFGILSSILGSY